LTERW